MGQYFLQELVQYFFLPWVCIAINKFLQSSGDNFCCLDACRINLWSLSSWHRPLLEVYTAQNSSERLLQWKENNPILNFCQVLFPAVSFPPGLDTILVNFGQVWRKWLMNTLLLLNGNFSDWTSNLWGWWMDNLNDWFDRFVPMFLLVKGWSFHRTMRAAQR